MLEIETRQIAYNRAKRSETIKYIVIHDTGNKAKGSDAEAHFKYFNGGNRKSSADFFVDSKRVLQANDYDKYYTYHVGDGKGKYGITNQNSVGIEICVNEDGDYDKAFENAVELTKHLMQVLNIPIERVVRHYDASRKNCPASMSEDNWCRWKLFKEAVNMSCVKELTEVNDIVWELSHRGIITDTELWLKKLEDDNNSYWLARKCLQHIRGLE